METRFPDLTRLLVGEALPCPRDDLRAALTEQVKRGGRGSEIAAAQLKGMRSAELRGAR